MSSATNRPIGAQKDYETCPLGLCRHPLLLHDRDEPTGPIVERCTVADCDCSGVSPTWLARVSAEMGAA